jgi:peroxiredoxin
MVELGELESHHQEFARRNVDVFVISNDDQPTAEATQKDFPNLKVVADTDQKLARAIAVLHLGVGPHGSDTNAPTTLLVAGDGTVRWLFRPTRFIERLPADQVLAAIDQHLPRTSAHGAGKGPAVPMGTKSLTLTRAQASGFAKLALRGLSKEYPVKPGDVLNGPGDIKSHKAMHPAFYGSFDWHSSVHGHWMLVRLLRLFPDLDCAKDIRGALTEHLTAKNLKAEADYFSRPYGKSFERTYGWAWLLKLAEELQGWDDADGKQWAQNLKPLADVLVGNYQTFLPKQKYPIRTGVHPNTAFGLAFALDYARAVGPDELAKVVLERSKSYYLKDRNAPAGWEPDGADFFSPSLLEADLMRRVLPRVSYCDWLDGYLPGLAKSEPKNLFEPVEVTDRTDPLLVHLDGLNLSRAWCMRGIATALPKENPARATLCAAAERHAKAGLAHVASGDYVGEHWLASFAVYLLSMPES